MRITSILLITILLISFSCENKNNISNDLIQPDKMRVILWDVIKAEAMATEFVRRDSNRNFMEETAVLQKNIFAIHKISKESFQKSFNFYTSRPAIMSVLMDSLTNKAYQSRPQVKPVMPVLTDSI